MTQNVEISPLVDKAIDACNDGKIELAEEIMEKAIILYGETEETLYYAGFVKMKKGELVEADRLVRKIIEFNQENPEVFYLMGTIKEKLNNYKSAVIFFAKALEKGIDDELIDFRIVNNITAASSHISHGPNFSERLFNGLISRDSSNPVLHFYAASYISKENLELAIKHFKKAYKMANKRLRKKLTEIFNKDPYPFSYIINSEEYEKLRKKWALKKFD